MPATVGVGLGDVVDHYQRMVAEGFISMDEARTGGSASGGVKMRRTKRM